jgi:hypothetical protein
MSVRDHLRIRPMVPLAIIVSGLLLVLSPAAAWALPDITIALKNAPSYCVNRKGGGNSAGTSVILYQCSGGNNHWYEDVGTQIYDPNCSSGQCIAFEDYWNTSECFGLSANDTGTLDSCDNEKQLWIANSDNTYRNVFWGQLLITNNDANGSVLSSYPSPILWHQWVGP